MIAAIIPPDGTTAYLATMGFLILSLGVLLGFVLASLFSSGATQDQIEEAREKGRYDEMLRQAEEANRERMHRQIEELQRQAK